MNAQVIIFEKEDYVKTGEDKNDWHTHIYIYILTHLF